MYTGRMRDIITAGQPMVSKWENVSGAQDWGLGIRTQIARGVKKNEPADSWSFLFNIPIDHPTQDPKQSHNDGH